MSPIQKGTYRGKGNNITEVETYLFSTLARQNKRFVQCKKDKPKNNKKGRLQKALNDSVMTKNFDQRLEIAKINICSILSTKPVLTLFNDQNSDNHSET